VILCVDVGNTLTKVALVDAGEVVARGATSSHGAEYRVRLAGSIAALVSSAAPARVARAVVSSVVPEATSDAVGAAAAHVEALPLLVSHQLPLPVQVAVAHPEHVGTDRLCAAAGAIDAARVDAIVVDVGSAVTVDLVVAGRFLGGVILPGPGMMLGALASSTSQLPRVDIGALPTLFPEAFDTTEHAMTLGAGLACLGGILEAVRRLTARAPDAPVRVTGGGVPWFDDRLPAGWRRDPDLCFRGLYRISCLNVSKK
jgi:type III pantothenate kinase